MRLAASADAPYLPAGLLSEKNNARGAAAEMAAGERKAALGALPQWDLADLYPGRDSPELARDLGAARRRRRAFRARYEGKLAALSGAELGAAIAAYERLQESRGRVMSYASLVYAGDMADPEIGRFYQNIQERVNAISTDAAVLHPRAQPHRRRGARRRKMADPALAHYRAVAARRPRLSPASALATSSKSCCTRNRSPAAPPGRGCSTRPSADLRFPFAARS